MTGIWLGVIGAIKSIMTRVLSEKFFVWLFFFAGEAIAKKTTNKLDDEFIAKAKELYEQGK